MPYKETIRTRVGRLSFQNENGQVTLIGQFNIGKIDLNNAVVISPLKVEFSNDLRSSLEMTFNEPIIDIVFNIDSEMYNHISENFNYFIKYKGEFYQPGEELEIALEDKEELSAYVLYK